MSTFAQRDVDSALFDCEKQLAKTRMRLKEIQKQKMISPSSKEHDLVILRKKVRMKGFVDEASIASNMEGNAAVPNAKMARRATLSSQDHEKIKDRIVRTFNLDEKRGLTMMRENGFGRTAEQTAGFLLNIGGLNREMIGRALGGFVDERGRLVTRHLLGCLASSFTKKECIINLD